MSDVAILKAALFTPGPKGLWGQPIRIVGCPGTAKTDIVTQVASQAGLHVVVVLASLRDPTDFLGLPVVRDGTVEYAPPDWVVEVTNRHPHSVVFFDEINTCSPATQAALLRVVLDRVVGQHRLPPTARILAAQNAVDEAAGGYDLAMPLANRFGTLVDWVGPDVDAWTDWLAGAADATARSDSTVARQGVAEAEEARVLKMWPSEYAAASGTIATFIRRKPSLLHSQPAAGSPQASLPWPSRRTWSMATRALAASRIHNLTEVETDRYVGSFVGLAAMVELRSFLAHFDLPDPAEVLDEVVGFKYDEHRIDRNMAVLSACASLVLPADAPRRQARVEVLWRIVGEVSKKAPDVAWPSVRVLCGKGTGLDRSKQAGDVLTRFHPMLVAAGLMRGSSGGG